MDHYNYNKNLKQHARKHRNHSTKAEVRLWCELLRDKKMFGYSFLRQRAISNYIADFFCKDLRLIIETDGLTHQWGETKLKDINKEKTLTQMGYTILRFKDEDVEYEIEKVREKIESWIKSHPPAPFKGGLKNGLTNEEKRVVEVEK